MIITIDGPAASGKTTMAKALARELNYRYVDTGAFYRCLALCVNNAGVDADRQSVIENAQISASWEGGKQIMHAAGVDVSERMLRLEEIGDFASQLSEIEYVRHRADDLIRTYVGDHDCVLEGRDTGSVIFPNADVKFYLNAMRYIRAERRYMDLLDRGIKSDYNALYNQIGERDDRDMNRDLDPLVIPKDAKVIDNSHMSAYTVLTTMEDTIEEEMRKKTHDSESYDTDVPM